MTDRQTEHSLGALQWLHGLEDYFKFIDDPAQQFPRFLLGLLYAQQPSIQLTDDPCTKEFVYALKKFVSDETIDCLYKYHREGLDPIALEHAFSRGQIQSKCWLAQELALINKDWTSVAIFAGWFGQLRLILKKTMDFQCMRILDQDPQACTISDRIFNSSELENYRVKSICADINDLTLHSDGYLWPVENFRSGKVYTEKFLPDLIINTSAEHMTEDWFFQIKHKDWLQTPVVAVQSNNLFDIPEHVNCVHSVDHMMKKFPMTEVLFSGELQLKGYKRVMLIGRA